ncbi:S-layer homology domain-containing protein [Lysinibacillus fusiformis]|uniref:S-layer homology domain-containing protein n=1 Tax=Lysinibacillus fusiformis TaxID=28031 RepID=UPI001F4EE63C|nr:S-layer homology domain-containing protein [Lysinibacillus fusiformis]MCK1990381.1 S-layer homology domain-containing protein [Lysinibacillus fusiformis]
MAKQNKGRKFFAASATAALVASAIVPVASAAQLNDFNKISGYAKEAVQSLVDAGVIQGDANGNFNPLKTISRAEAATIFTNALELEAEGAVDFKDVKADAWYYDAIAATVENGIFEGVSATEFAPNKQLTRSEAAKILVDAFGLEGEGDLSEFADASTVKPWAKSYLEIAVANGVIKGSEANGKTNLNPNAPITRQDFAVVFSRTVENVDATPKVDKIEVVDAKTLNVTLSDGTKETVTLETALEPNKETEVTFKIKDVEYKAKVTYVVTTATAVKSVSATNLKEVVVEFDGTVDEDTATDKANYTLKSGKAVKSVKLSDDKKTATVTVVGTLTNNKADAISVSNVKAGDKVINVKNVEFTAVDNKLPEVTSLKSLGTKSVKLEFSEPVTDLKQSNFTLDGKAYFGKVTLGANDRSVILTPFSSSALSVGDHKLTVTGVKDFAGFVSLSSTHDFKVVEDKDAPTVTEATATLESVTLTFSEDVDAETVKASNVYWKSGDSKKAASGEVEALADNKYKFYFTTTNSLPTGKVDVYVEGVKDFSDNQIAKDTKVTVTPEIDQTRPEVKKVSVEDARTIKVTFSKALNEDSAKDVKNYTVLNKDGKVVSVQSAALDPKDSKSVIVKLYTDLSVGENKLTIKNIKDATKLQNTMFDYSEKIVRADKGAPSYVSSVNTKDKRVVLKFDKKMDVDTLVDYSNYLVKINGNLRTLNADIADISVMQDGTAVVITFAETISGNDVVFTSSTTPASGKVNVNTLSVLGLKDASGNLLKEFAAGGTNNVVDLSTSTTLAVDQFDKDKHAGKVAELTDRKTIKVHFNTGVTSASSEAFVAKVNGSEVAIDSVQIDGTSDVVIKLKEELKDTGAIGFDLKVDYTKLVDIAGNTGSTTAATIDVATNLLDSVKPVIVDNTKTYTVANNEEINITYTEALSTVTGASQDLLDSDFKITRISDNKELNPIGDYNVAVGTGADNNKVIITLTDTAKRDVATAYRVEVKDAKYFKDASGNFISDSIGESAKVTYVTADSTASAKAALTTSINAAQAAHDDVAVIEGPIAGNTIVGSKVTLASAIAAATTVSNNTAATVADLNTAKSTLDAAVTTFKAAKVADISSALVAPTTLTGTGAKAAITGISVTAPETFTVTSADTSVVTVDAPTGLDLTSVAAGKSVITVQVKNAAGSVIKAGTVEVTVAP